MKRKLAAVCLDRIGKERAVALLGPRQAGKSFLLEQILKERKGTYVSFDDPLVRQEATEDPVSYLRRRYQPGSLLLIDEAAKVPVIFDGIKVLIDEQGAKPSRICLANSGNYLLMKRIKESLVGRVNLLWLYPLSWQEFSGSDRQPGVLDIIKGRKLAMPASPPSILEINRGRQERLVWGGFPVPALAEDLEFRKRWVADYLKTYVFPILIEQFNIRAIEAFEKCARLLFLQSSNFLNYNRLAQETGISQPTAVGYVHQLKTMMLIVTLEVYTKNARKRLIKQPKVHVVDPLLLHHALGTDFNFQTAREKGWAGAIYESFIAMETIKTLENNNLPYKLFTWRTADKAEVDLVLECGGRTIPLEIKSSEKLSRKDISGLQAFLADNPHVKQGYIIYPGKELQSLANNLLAIPDWLFLGAA